MPSKHARLVTCDNNLCRVDGGAEVNERSDGLARTGILKREGGRRWRVILQG